MFNLANFIKNGFIAAERAAAEAENAKNEGTAEGV